jgi:predicted RNA-binding Zn-ribbon protein involved in translation (DUF1610 family)
LQKIVVDTDIFLFPFRLLDALRVFSYKCPSCNYESRHQLGSPDMDQTLTDVNTEFAQYGLFVCKKEQKFVQADMLDSQFDGKCPSDGSELEEVKPLEAKCPRCGKDLEIGDAKPLATTDSGTE